MHESIAEELLLARKKAMVELYGTDPKSRPDDYSRIISPKATERLAGLIDQKKVAIGGASDPDARYLDPTVIYPVTWDASNHGRRDIRTDSPNPHLQGHEDAAIREVKWHPEASFRLFV